MSLSTVDMSTLQANRAHLRVDFRAFSKLAGTYKCWTQCLALLKSYVEAVPFARGVFCLKFWTLAKF